MHENKWGLPEYDGLFEVAFGRVGVVRALLRRHLGGSLQALLDLRTLRRSPCRLLGEGELYAVGVYGDQARVVYVLMAEEDRVPLLLRDEDAIKRHHLQQHGEGEPPVMLFLLFCHGGAQGALRLLCDKRLALLSLWTHCLVVCHEEGETPLRSGGEEPPALERGESLG